jgi:hypothetical protein
MYMHDWAESQREGMINDFNIAEADLVGTEILLASYSYEDYSGSAYVLFRRDGKLFEVFGGHCSCYGLEDQWEPEEVPLVILLKRIEDDSSYFGEFSAEMRELLIKLSAES